MSHRKCVRGVAVQSKLTLRLDEELIERARAYSRRTGKSLSKLVGDYFSLLERADGDESESLPPVTRSLLGALAGSGLDETDYREHLENKQR